MLDKRNYDLDYIHHLHEKYRRDPGLIERVIFAFGLLEAIKISGMPFVFKGGTCLMLLFEHPMRLSTDIDIIVKPNTNVDAYLHKAGELFPFLSYEEQIRVGRNKIEKRHFKFIYYSPTLKKNFYILLDILFSEIPYVKTIQREIQNELLLVTSEKVTVTIPSAECILGDKLTAFAPHTTGIPVGIGKSLEIAKQLFDVATLTDILFDYNSLKATYDNAVTDELAYRGLAIGRHEVLTDTINTCISIISRGILNKEDFPEYLKGIQAVASHIISYKYSGEIAAHQACKVLYLATVLLKEKDFTRITTPETYIHESIANTEYKKLSWIRKQNLEAYGYLYEAIKLLSEK